MPALGGAAAVGASMSQDTSVDDWNDVGRLDEAVAAGVPAALRQVAKRDLEQNGASDALQPAAQQRKTEIVEISDDEDSPAALSDDEVFESAETEAGAKVAAAWRSAARCKKMDLALRERFAVASVAVRQHVEAIYAELDVHQRGALYEILIEKPWLVVVSGPAGSGKSALIKILVLLMRDEMGVVTPTQGARRADQQVHEELSSVDLSWVDLT